MRGAAAEEGEREHDELRRAQRRGDGHVGRRRQRLRRRTPARCASRDGGRRTNRAAGIMQAPGDDADRQHRGAPVIGRGQPARERRDRHRRHAHARRDQRDGEAAVLVEPVGDGGDHRREKGAGGEADEDAIGELEFEQRGGPARQHQRRARAAPRRTARRAARRNRSLAAPQPKPAAPMARKSSVIAVDMPARDQPVPAAIGCRNTASENMAPMATQEISAPAATMTHP